MDSYEKMSNRFRNFIVTAVLLGMLLYMGFYFICLFSDSCYVEYDAIITELGVCLDASSPPIQTIPVDVEQIYVCGEIEGTTPRRGALYVFRQKQMVSHVNIEPEPGAFRQLVKFRNPLEVSEYRVEIQYERVVLAKTKFEVVSQ